jgi:photosystem II stability/assembly factor-like uncharacterized protein
MKKIFILFYAVSLIIGCSSSDSSASSGWELVNSPSTSSNTISNFISNGNALFCILSNNSIYRSTDNGNSWSVLNTGITNYDNLTLFSINDVLYISAFKNGVPQVTLSTTKYYKSTNNGDSWAQTWNTLVNTGNGLPSTIYLLGNKLVGATNGTNAYVYSSSDNGLTWSSSNNPLMSILKIKMIFDESNYYFVTAQNIYKSNDAINFTQVNNWPSPIWNSAVSTIGNKIYVSCGGISLSNDGGLNWNPINQGLELTDSAYNLISCLYSENQKLYAGAEGGGVYKLNSNSQIWSEIGGYNDNENDIYVTGTVNFITSVNGYLFAVTGEGLYRHSL